MGFRETCLWNTDVSKLAWAVAQKDNMSVIWINVIYIGDANWDTYETPNYSSWAWKYICQAKNEICMKLQGEQWMASNHYSIKK